VACGNPNPTKKQQPERLSEETRHVQDELDAGCDQS